MRRGSPVVRLRELTDAQRHRLELLRQAARLLDSAVPLPGTGFRFGLDPIVGLIPAFGDVISPLFTVAILWQARDLNLPRVVQLRMIFNVAIDTLIGLVPIAGDLFDFAWTANDMNVALLERYAFEERRASVGDWLFVSILIVALLALAVLPFIVVGWLVALGSRLAG